MYLVQGVGMPSEVAMPHLGFELSQKPVWPSKQALAGYWVLCLAFLLACMEIIGK